MSQPQQQQQLANVNLFVIVGSGDVPIYEADLSSTEGRRDDSTHLDQFVIHAALDEMDSLADYNKTHGIHDMRIERVDSFNDFHVVGMLTSHPDIRFLLLHRYVKAPPPLTLGGTAAMSASASVDQQIEYRHKVFLQEAYQYYSRAILNPLYPIPQTALDSGLIQQRIQSRGFDIRIKNLAKKLLIW